MSSFLQTVLWVGLIAWAVLRYDTLLKELLNALRRRIDDGASVEVPGLRIGSQPKDVQRELLEVETEEARDVNILAPSNDRGMVAEEVPTRSDSVADSRNDVIEVRPESAVLKDVEDSQTLSLRFLARELNLPVHQGVTINGRAVDGAIFKQRGGLDAIVEVKYVEFAQQLPAIKMGAKRLRASWLSDNAIAEEARIVYVVVVAWDDLRAEAKKKLAALAYAANYDRLPIELKIYSLDALRKEFG